jgi:hypothetical protein
LFFGSRLSPNILTKHSLSEAEQTSEALCFVKKIDNGQSKQDKQCTYNVTLRRVHETIVAVEKQ